MDDANSNSTHLGEPTRDKQGTDMSTPGAVSGDIWGGSPVVGDGTQSDEPRRDAQGTDMSTPGAVSGDIWGGSPVVGGGTPDASGTSGSTTDVGDISNSGTTPDEEFTGSGGVGSPEYLDNLRKAHEAAGDGFSSAYGGEDTPKG